MPKSPNDQNAEMRLVRESLRDDVKELCRNKPLALVIAALQEVQFDLQFEERMFQESIKDLTIAEQHKRTIARLAGRLVGS